MGISRSFLRGVIVVAMQQDDFPAIFCFPACALFSQSAATGWIGCTRYSIIPRYHGPLAQWLEQATHNRLVVGSNPTGATK